MEAMQESAYRRPAGSRYRFDPREEETMMRDGVGGLTPVAVPEARGYSAALDSFLAQGGSRFQKSGLFKKGRLKGKSLSEAQAEFERLWASAPDSVKNKYAGMRSNDGMLAPSERLTPVNPAMEGKTPQERRMAYYGFKMGKDGVPVRIGSKKPQGAQKISKEEAAPGGEVVAGPPKPEGLTSVQPVTQELKTASMTADSQAQAMAGGVRDMSGPTLLKQGGDLSQAAMGTPEQQAQIRAMIEGNTDLGTASVGNYMDMQAAVAAGNRGGWAQSNDPDIQPVIDEANAVNAQAVAAASAAVTAAQQANVQAKQAAERQRRGLPPVSTPTVQATPGSVNSALERQFPGVQGNQPSTLPGGFSGGPGINPPKPPAVPVAAPAPVPAQPAAPAAAPAAKTSVSRPRIGATPAGQELIGMKSGVPQYAPMAEVYGQSATTIQPPMAAAPTDQQVRDNFQRSATAQGVRAQAMPRPMTPVSMPRPTALQQSAINRPRVSPPGTNTVEGRAADEMRRQAGINANPSTVNPPGLVAGARKPLNQLIAPPPKAIPVKRTVLPR